MTAPPPPTLDFATHTLLAGKTKTLGTSQVLAQQVVQTCAGYTYTVQLDAAEGKHVASVVYYAVVPKILVTAHVTFEVQLAPPLTTTSGAPTPER